MKGSPAGGARTAVRGGILLAVSLGLLLLPAGVSDSARMAAAAPLRPMQWLAFAGARRTVSLLSRLGGTAGEDSPSIHELAERVRRLEADLAYHRELLHDALSKLETLAHALPADLTPVAAADVVAYDASDWRKSLVVGG